MQRVLKSALIGGGAAVAVGGVLYVLQQQQELSRSKLPLTISSEWNFPTKKWVVEASQTPDVKQKAQYFAKALDSVVSSSTDINTKSQNWLAGYADLLRSLGLAQQGFDPEAAIEPLKAARSIPFGHSGLRAQAQTALYELTNDPAHLNASLVGEIPAKLDTNESIRMWAPFLLLKGQLALQSGDKIGSLNHMVHLHAKILAKEDPLCFRAKSGGFIGQILWSLGKTSESEAWIIASLQDIQCNTPACKETRAVLDQLLTKISEKKQHTH